MTSSKHSIFTKLYDAFNSRDIETVLAMMHPDVDWPNGWEGGRMSGRSEVRAYWVRQFQAIDPHVEPIGFHADPSRRTIVDVHAVVRDPAGNVVADEMIQHVYLLEDGLIRSMEIRKPNA